MRTWIKTIVDKFAISNYTALILAVHALRSYSKLIVNMGFIFYQIEVTGAKDHGKNYIKVRPPLVRHLLRNRLFFLIGQIKCLVVNDSDARGRGHFHINLYRTCRFSGYHFQHKFQNGVGKLIRNSETGYDYLFKNNRLLFSLLFLEISVI